MGSERQKSRSGAKILALASGRRSRRFQRGGRLWGSRWGWNRVRSEAGSIFSMEILSVFAGKEAGCKDAEVRGEA